MSKKIIASSYSMYHFLDDCKLSLEGLDDETDIRIEDGRFQLPELTDKNFLCESRGDALEKISVYKLEKLRDVLGEITDQPITIVFNRNRIEITGIEI